jgi:Tol biopolymer transport system component
MSLGIRKAAVIAGMCAFGISVYFGLGALRGGIATVVAPTSISAASVPGSIYVGQKGGLYRLQAGRFQALTAAGDGWMQPAVSADGRHLLAVERRPNYSDVFLLDPKGGSPVQLTRDDSQVVELNHWAFFPEFAADGKSFFYSYDAKDPYNSYRVDLTVYSQTLPPAHGRIVRWTSPNDYTGGDADPRPLKSGGIVYTKFSIDDAGVMHSQVWIQGHAGSSGVALTTLADDCAQPSLSADENTVAMVCRHGGKTGSLEVARFASTGVGLLTPHVLVEDRLVGAPVFSPDSTQIAFFAPVDEGGPFQLWTVALGRPGAARQITWNLDLDTSAPPAWVA